jgi:hypothetical protein
MQADTNSAALPRFFLKAAAALVLVTGAWWFVADIAALPAAWVAKLTAQSVFSDLVRHANVGKNTLELETHMRVNMAQMPGGQAAPRGMVAELVVDARPAKYGYSLPLLLALLISGSRKKLARNAALGAVCLIPVQAFSLLMDVLKQAALGAGPAVTAQTGWGQWQLELVGYGYQLGVLLVPTLVPVLLWLWLDRQFFATVLVEGWLRNAPVQER